LPRTTYRSGRAGQVSDTALTSETAISLTRAGCRTPSSRRNLLFFTFTAAVGYRRGARHLVGGMCETDYSGYPDCRDDTLKALQATLSLGMEHRFVIHTPLMWRDKRATWELTQRLGGGALVELVREETHSLLSRPIASTVTPGAMAVATARPAGCGGPGGRPSPPLPPRRELTPSAPLERAAPSLTLPRPRGRGGWGPGGDELA